MPPAPAHAQSAFNKTHAGNPLVTDAIYAFDTDNMTDDGLSGGGHAVSITDSAFGYVAAADTSNPSTSHPAIDTTFITGHKTASFSGGAHHGFSLFNATPAGALNGSVDYTMICRVRLGFITTTNYLQAHQLTASATYAPTFTTNYAGCWQSWSPANSWFYSQGTGSGRTDMQFASTLDTTTMHTVAYTVLGANVLCYYDGVLRSSVSRGTNYPAGLNNIALGSSSGIATPNMFRFWGAYSTAFDATRQLAAHTALVARDL